MAIIIFSFQSIALQYQHARKLQAETNRIAKEIDNREDFADVLHEIAAQNDFLIEVSDEDGATVLHAGKETEVHVKNTAAELFHLGDKVYLLKVTQMMQLKHISAYEIAWSIFTAEIIIIIIILLFYALPIY